MQWIMTDITEEAATEVGEESKAEEASVKKETQFVPWNLQLQGGNRRFFMQILVLWILRRRLLPKVFYKIVKLRIQLMIMWSDDPLLQIKNLHLQIFFICRCRFSLSAGADFYPYTLTQYSKWI